MDLDTALFFGQQAMITALTVAGPLLVTALLVGTTISLIQSVTQVQEMTLVFVPKMLGVFLIFSLAGGWMLQHVVDFSTAMFESIGTP
ncbi:MAG: flagellar biosynthetic protein FliQ [Myxococcota bacterium]|nr:flagellar biosynthetic protein FliQ [Myxococcota bacterium]